MYVFPHPNLCCSDGVDELLICSVLKEWDATHLIFFVSIIVVKCKVSIFGCWIGVYHNEIRRSQSLYKDLSISNCSIDSLSLRNKTTLYLSFIFFVIGYVVWIKEPISAQPLARHPRRPILSKQIVHLFRVHRFLFDVSVQIGSSDRLVSPISSFWLLFLFVFVW